MARKKKKVKKPRTFSLIILIAGFLFIGFFVFSQQTVKILYFRNEKCRISLQTDQIIQDVAKQFDGSVIIKTYNVKLYPSDPPDPPEVKLLREKYRVIGVPEIVINGKEYAGKYTKEDLFKAVCNNFILKPEVCK